VKDLINYIWIAFIAATMINALVWWRRGRDHIARKPELGQGYKRLVLGFIFWGSVPWAVMGLGLLVGGVSSCQDYLKPQGANPWVLAWYVTVICLWVLSLWWIFGGNGAQALVDHPGLFNFPLPKPKHVKLLACAMTLSGSIGVAIVFSHGMLLPYWPSQADGYTTIFIVYDGFWRVVALAVLFLAIGAVGLVAGIAWIRRAGIPKWWNRKEGTKPGFLLVWSILWLSLGGVGFSVNLYRSYQLVSAYRDGTAQLVEGTVHVLREQPEGGHAGGDLIEINGTQLVIDYFQVTPAYRQTIAHGGVLREGTSARVWHDDGKILRLDVPRVASP